MIPYNNPTFGKEEKAVLRTIKKEWIVQDQQVDVFEDKFCQFLNLPKGYAGAYFRWNCCRCLYQITLFFGNR